MAMFEIQSCDDFLMQAATTFRMACSKCVFAHPLFLATFAFAKEPNLPSTITSNSAENGKSTKLLSNHAAHTTTAIGGTQGGIYGW